MTRHRNQSGLQQQIETPVKITGMAARLERASNMVTQTIDTDEALREHANFSALMQAITRCQTALTSKIDSLQLEMDLMQKDYDKIRNRDGRGRAPGRQYGGLGARPLGHPTHRSGETKASRIQG